LVFLLRFCPSCSTCAFLVRPSLLNSLRRFFLSPHLRRLRRLYLLLCSAPLLLQDSIPPSFLGFLEVRDLFLLFFLLCRSFVEFILSEFWLPSSGRATSGVVFLVRAVHSGLPLHRFPLLARPPFLLEMGLTRFYSPRTA